MNPTARTNALPDALEEPAARGAGAEPLSTDAAARLVAELVALLRVQPLDADRYRGETLDIGTRAVFGGQVLGQALMAASATAERPIHSLHAYFLLAGDKKAPIDYAVERVRDGRSFATRRVVAQQHGRTIFTMMASFQAAEPDSMQHQSPMPPPASGPEGLQDEIAQRRALGDRLPASWRGTLGDSPIDYRNVDPQDLLAPPPASPDAQMWLRAAAAVPDEPALHRALLAYASDHGLLRSAMRRHGLSFMQPSVHGASLDHAMWFHRDFRIDEWLLYCMDSPSAQSGRALCRGQLFTRGGVLVASTAQEGMLRVFDTPR